VLQGNGSPLRRCRLRRRLRGTPLPYSGSIIVEVFLSHSSKDKPFVRDLADALEAGGEIKVWLDEREIDYGENIVLKIADGLDADFILLILSPDSVDSKWVKKNGRMPTGSNQ
jgi:TIR domain